MIKRFIIWLAVIPTLAFLMGGDRLSFGAPDVSSRLAGAKKTTHPIKLGPPDNVQRYGNMNVAKNAFSRLDTSNYDKPYLSSGKGICNYADKTRGKAVVSAIKAGSPLSWGYAGFQTFGIMNTGRTDWPNVTIKATIHVTEAIGQGGMICVSFFNKYGMPLPDSWNDQAITAPGTYVITSQPIPIRPDETYCAFAAVGCEAFDIPGDVAGVSAVIRSIKINL